MRQAEVEVEVEMVNLPVLNLNLDLSESEVEEAAVCLGANRWQTFSRVIFPALLPSVLTGFALAFARTAGEYGSVIFIAGNMPMVSEITPLLIIITRLEQYDYVGATAIASTMLAASFMCGRNIFLRYKTTKKIDKIDSRGLA